MSNTQDELVIGEFEGTNGNTVLARVVVGGHNKEPAIDIRQVFFKKDGELRYSQKGFRVSISNFEVLKQVMKQVDIAITTIGENDNE